MNEKCYFKNKMYIYDVHRYVGLNERGIYKSEIATFLPQMTSSMLKAFTPEEARYFLKLTHDALEGSLSPT